MVDAMVDEWHERRDKIGSIARRTWFLFDRR